MTELSKEKRAEKIDSLKYPNRRDIFYHPKTIGEFIDLQKRLLKCKENEDIQGLFVLAMQLIPTNISSETETMDDDEVEKSLKEIADAYPEVALAWINERVYCDCDRGRGSDLEWS